MRYLLSLSLAGFVLLAFAGRALAFRPINSEDVAREQIEASEANFSVRNHAELYNYTRVDTNGHARSGQMLIIYAYSEDEVSGVFRLLPRDDFPGATLLYRQQLNGGGPTLYLHDPTQAISGELPVWKWWSRLGDTDWRCWLIIDEDKNPWRYVKVDHIVYRGHPVNVITARYDDRTVASLTGVRQRRLYLNRERDIGHAVEYLDHRGDPLTVLELLEHQAFELEGKTQFRTRRLLLHNFEEQTMTAQVRRDTVFNTQLPEELFEPEQIDEWDGRWDAEVMRLLGDTHATEVPDEVKLTLQASGRITSVVVRRASDRQSLWTGSLREGEEASITIGEKVVILATSIENLSVRLRGETFRSEGSGIGKLTFEPGGPSR